MNNKTIAVIGLGYVGLPLVVEFGKKFRTIGFDISRYKVECCQSGEDPSFELSGDEIKAAVHATYTDNPAALAEADVIIVAVPTPVDDANIPDFRPLVGASATAGRHLKNGALVVYESTVYPGATEEICIPVLERESGLQWKQGFNVGYSPERINPGDKERTLTKIVKIVSGDNPDTLQRVAELYEEIIEPGVHRASCMKAAEAAKVIENTQRDLNIALMNELALIFDKLDIDTNEVLEAAGTKWNFLKFKPGLVGGHCIGVDPYYLTHKAEMLGYHPQVILAGRRINDSMGKYIAEVTVKKMIAAGSVIRGSSVNVLGLTFKEDCADLRNSKVIDIIRELQNYCIHVSVTDAYADPEEALCEHGVNLLKWEELPQSDAIIAAVSHSSYKSLSPNEIGQKLKRGGCFIDVKSAFDAQMIRDAGFTVWRL